MKRKYNRKNLMKYNMKSVERQIDTSNDNNFAYNI